MKISVQELRRLVKEELELNEFFGKKKSGGWMETLKSTLDDFMALNKKVEQAHQEAPGGPAKAIIAGIHSDLFNKAAEMRQYLGQLAQMAKGVQPAHEGQLREGPAETRMDQNIAKDALWKSYDALQEAQGELTTAADLAESGQLRVMLKGMVRQTEHMAETIYEKLVDLSG